MGVDNVRYNSFEAILDPRGAFGAVFTDHGDPSEFTQTFDFPEFDPTLFTSPTEPIFFGASIGGAISDINGLGVSLEPITTIQPKTLRATLFDVDDDEVATIDIYDVFGGSTNPETVPEPSTVVSLISLSVLGLAFSRRKQG